MNKKTIVICSIILSLAIALTVLFNSNNNNVLRENGVTYALTVDGVSKNEFPDKGMYRVDPTCTNAKCKWDYEAWKLYIEDVTGNVSCHLEFTSISKNNFNSYIIGLSGTTQGEGQVVKENGYRYEGMNPNNYVLFNGELWRIIGVFDSSSHGVSSTNLVKIIRNESIGGLVWNSNESNDLTALLNGYYLISTDVTSRTICSGHGYNSSSKCDYRLSGIKATYRGMIKEVTWHLGGYYNNITIDSLYGYERNTGSTVSGKVGLMYASDYGYAVPSTYCSRTSSLDSHNDANCTLNNWLYKMEYEWTLTKSPNYVVGVGYDAFSVGYTGKLIVYGANNGSNVRPTLYLNENVYVIDGTGSEADPYIIGMD